MKLIAHRGNINGKSELENSPEYILQALQLGYDVEIDVWYKDGKIMLGHDEPKYDFTWSLIFDYGEKMWFHAKNVEALNWFIDDEANSLNYFWHDEDDYTLTSKNYIWTYPEKQLTKKSICVLPEWNKFKQDVSGCAGVCSDYIEHYTQRPKSD